MSEAVSAYFIWGVFVAPFAGAVLVPLLKKAPRVRDYAAVLFSFVSAVFALSLLVPTLQGQTVGPSRPTSVPWITALGINVGVLYDPFTIILSNVVAWVSFLIMVYSLEYMKGDSGLTRYWFFMNFFIGSMQLIVLSDNFLSMFVGWEGVGLCSFALIGFWFTDEKDRWVGTVGSMALGEAQAYPPSHAGMKAFVMTRIGDVAFLAASQALVGFELKKILAYSTVSQIGYMMMALGLTGLSTDFAQGLSAGLYHLMSHAIFKASLFMGAGALIHVSESKYISDMGGLRAKMKMTFAAFLIAAASLSGIPPFSGFWSKDAVLATAWDSGQTGLFLVGALTAGLTAFYSFRMLGIVFYGKQSLKLDELEKEGHPAREVSPLMWVPYMILAVGTVLIGVLSAPLGLENGLEWASNAYLASLFPRLSGVSGAPVGFNALYSLIALGFVGIAFAIAWTLYVTRKYSASKLVHEEGFMHVIYTFLENRWYINAVYYRVFVDAPIRASRWLLSSLEIRGLDRVNNAGAYLGINLSTAGNWIDAHVIDGVANGISSAGQAFSRTIRKVQTGITEQYIFVFALGLALLIVGLLFGAGVRLF